MKEQTPASLRAIVLGAIALCIIGSLTGAKAGQDKNGVLRIAVFDPGMARLKYTYVQQAEQDFQKKVDDTDFTLGVWRTNPLLVETDQKKLSELMLEERKQGNALDDAKKNEIKALQEKSKMLLQEFNQLQSIGNALTPTQRDRIGVLIRAQSDTETRITTTGEKARVDLQKIQDDANNKILMDTRNAVNKIAKEKGFTLVLSNAVAWYGDSDITDQVISSLNKK